MDSQTGTSGKQPVLIHLIQNYQRDDKTGEEYWTTGRLPNYLPVGYHWRLPQCVRILDLVKRRKDAH